MASQIPSAERQVGADRKLEGRKPSTVKARIVEKPHAHVQRGVQCREKKTGSSWSTVKMII